MAINSCPKQLLRVLQSPEIFDLFGYSVQVLHPHLILTHFSKSVEVLPPGLRYMLQGCDRLSLQLPKSGAVSRKWRKRAVVQVLRV